MLYHRGTSRPDPLRSAASRGQRSGQPQSINPCAPSQDFSDGLAKLPAPHLCRVHSPTNAPFAVPHAAARALTRTGAGGRAQARCWRGGPELITQNAMRHMVLFFSRLFCSTGMRHEAAPADRPAGFGELRNLPNPLLRASHPGSPPSRRLWCWCWPPWTLVDRPGPPALPLTTQQLSPRSSRMDRLTLPTPSAYSRSRANQKTASDYPRGVLDTSSRPCPRVAHQRQAAVMRPSAAASCVHTLGNSRHESLVGCSAGPAGHGRPRPVPHCTRPSGTWPSPSALICLESPQPMQFSFLSRQGESRVPSRSTPDRHTAPNK